MKPAVEVWVSRGRHDLEAAELLMEARSLVAAKELIGWLVKAL